MKPIIKENRWDKDLEKPVYELWKKTNAYKFEKNSKKPLFSIDTPPPYVNTPVHIGQATTYVMMDMFARFKRMTGHNILFPLGLDRNGLPIEMTVEKRFNISIANTAREDFLKKCAIVLKESSEATTESFMRLGIGFSSWKLGKNVGDIYMTDSPEYRSLTQDTFIDLWNKGLVYEAERINNFCPGCHTTIADAEIEYEDLPTKWNDIVFKVKETGEEIIIGTTRQELICTCGMLIFHPNDKRYRHLNGKTALTPLYEKEVPIKAHTLVDMKKGTGLAMMCSAGDLSDIRFFREQNIEPVIAISKEGTMNEHAGFLKSLKVVEARNAIIEELKKESLLRGQKDVTHRTPICERSKDPIEFIAMKEFYLKQIDYKQKMRLLAKKLNFFATESRQILMDWIDAISIDWPISRRRYCATEIPLWYCEDCGGTIVPPKGKYYQPWKEKPPIKCKCGSENAKGEERVFDTWFDSSISPLYILKWSRDDKFFNKNKLCTLRPQGKEIIRTWLYYTLLKCYLLTGELIFKDAWINYHIVDENGNKMSKSKGNVIDPKQVLDKFGAEPFRLWTVVEGNLEKADMRCSFERIEGASKTLTKLWNVARFISIFSLPKKLEKMIKKNKLPKLQPTDTWIINEMNALIKDASQNYEKYDFHTSTTKAKHFIWETFASHYLELIKTRAYNQNKIFTKEENESALFTIHYCLDRLLKLLAPVLPFITYKIYKDIRKKDIHFETFPREIKAGKTDFTTDNIIELNGKIWKLKKDKGKSLKDPVTEVVLPKKFRLLEKDLKATHNIQKIKFSNTNKLSLKL